MAVRSDQYTFDAFNSQGKQFTLHAERLIFVGKDGKEHYGEWKYVTKNGMMVEFDSCEDVYRIVNTGEVLWL